MDKKEQTSPVPENGNWLDEILGTSDSVRELGPDELAIQAAGLTHPKDAQLEQILAEDWDSVPDLPQQEAYTPAEPSAPEQSAAGASTEAEAAFENILSEISQEIKEDSAPEKPACPEATQFFTPVESSKPQPAAEEAPVKKKTQRSIFAAKKPASESKPAAEKKAVEKKPASVKKEKPKKAAPVQADTSAANAGRPEKKSGYGLWSIPHLVSVSIWLMIIVLVGVTLGTTIWTCCADLMAFGKEDQKVTITITERDDIDSISQKLKDAKIINYPTLFKMFATLTGKDEDIQIGTFTLNRKLDYNALINNMYNYGPAREEIDVMIPEGYTCAQIFALLEKRGVCDAKSLEEYAANGELGNYWFLEGIKRGDKYCLEGFMFPDTYKFYTNDTPDRVIKKFLDGFDYRFTDVMREKLTTIESRTGMKLSIYQVVIIASMIEKETASNSESYDISSVIFNRLNHSASFPFLNIDATLIYALNGNIDPATGSTKPLTNKDLEMEHPYNTYKNQGLPPGPISNPGRNSLDAALDPNETGYYYYVYNPGAGRHLFAKSLWEHENNIWYVNSIS